MALRADIKTLRKKRHRSRAFYVCRKAFYILSCVLFLIFGASWLSYAPFLQIEDITLLGIGPRAHREARAAEASIAHVFAVQGAALFSPYNIFLYPRRALEEAVAISSPRIASAALARGGRIVLVFVAERKPFARWCAETPRLSCVWVDEQGAGFGAESGDAPPASATVLVSARPMAGERFLPQEGFALLKRALAAAERVGLSVSHASRGEGDDIVFGLADGAEVRFVLGARASNLFLSLPETLSAAKLTIAAGSVAPPLHYLDLRFSDQAVFKRK